VKSALVLLTLARVASAEPALERIAKGGVLRVGMVAGTSPFVVAGAEAEALSKRIGDPTVQKAVDGRAIAGFDVDLMAEVARALRCKLEVTLVERHDLMLDGLRAGRYELAASALTRTLDRARTVAFSDPYFSSGLEVRVRDATRFAELPALDRAEVRIAYLAGTTAETFAKKSLAHAKLESQPNESALFAAMDDAKIDAIVIDQITARDGLERGRAKNRLASLEDRRYTTEQFAWAARQGDPDFVAWLNLFLREAKSTGAFHKLAARYHDWFRTVENR
jgi:polar amino acid transport system substrate-binding protein